MGSADVFLWRVKERGRIVRDVEALQGGDMRSTERSGEKRWVELRRWSTT